MRRCQRRSSSNYSHFSASFREWSPIEWLFLPSKRRKPGSVGRRFLSKVLLNEHAHTLHRLWRHPRESRETLRRFQVRKLQALLAHCRARVAVYRDHWQGSDLQPEDITWPEALEALPTIGKDDLRARPVTETLVDGADPKRLVRHMTSGSSGQPFAIYRSRREEHLLNLFRVRAYAGAGLRVSDRIARFSQLPLDEAYGDRAGGARRMLGIYRDIQLNGLASADEMAGQLVRSRPTVVAGYPSILLHVAARMLEDQSKSVRARLVLCGGEVVEAAARRVIEEGFSAPLADFYGAHEFNLLAWQCPAGGYHVCDDNVLLEIIDESGRPVKAGETGEVVATALHSYTMPFVRYRTGDLAIRGPEACRCGQPFSTLLAIQGRAVDYLLLPNGRRVHPYAITVALAEREAEWVSQHQVVQTCGERIQLNVLPRRAPRIAELQRLRAFATSVLGTGIDLDIALVARFPRHPSGKFRPYVCRVKEADTQSPRDYPAAG